MDDDIDRQAEPVFQAHFDPGPVEWAKRPVRFDQKVEVAAAPGIVETGAEDHDLGVLTRDGAHHLA